MEKLTTSVDQHDRMLIPARIRERLHIHPGQKVTLEINDNQIKIVSTRDIIDELHAIFTENQPIKNGSAVDDFISQRRQEYLIEEKRAYKNKK